MAKLLMSCDDYVYCYKGKFYARNQDKYDFYQRYLRVFEELRLTTRCIYEETLGKSRVLLDDPRIEFRPLPFFSGPVQYAKVYFKIEKLLKNITEGCDAAILRLPSTVAQRVADKVIKSGIPYGTELVFDAKDAMTSATNCFERVLWRRIHQQMVSTCNIANGVACVTAHYLQTHYTSKRTDAFFSNYSSLALPKSFYTSERKYPVDKEFVISHVCTQVQFNGRKGYNEIIEAMKILKDRGVAVRVDFAGPDYHNGMHLLQILAKKLRVEDRIRFIGGVSRSQLSDYLEASDLYVMPTWAEGLPRVIIEAMAKGLPCITTPVSGNPELVSEHFLVDYYDIKTLADRIEELVKNKSLYEKISKENYERSLQYEASVLEKKRDAYYRELKSCIK